jgi:hypothetical protein
MLPEATDGADNDIRGLPLPSVAYVNKPKARVANEVDSFKHNDMMTGS